jgi:hypothetical protein
MLCLLPALGIHVPCWPACLPRLPPRLDCAPRLLAHLASKVVVCKVEQEEVVSQLLQALPQRLHCNGHGRVEGGVMQCSTAQGRGRHWKA